MARIYCLELRAAFILEIRESKHSVFVAFIPEFKGSKTYVVYGRIIPDFHSQILEYQRTIGASV